MCVSMLKYLNFTVARERALLALRDFVYLLIFAECFKLCCI